MNFIKILLVVIGVIIFILAFIVNSQPAGAIMWFVGVILVAIGLSKKKQHENNKS